MIKTLYLKDAKGKLRVWEIETDTEGFWIRHGLLGGAMQEEYEEVPYGLATRSQAEQIESMAKSKIKKRMENGYCDSVIAAEARGGRGDNDMGFPRPMLATPYKNIKNDVSDYYRQPKLDGHRCLFGISKSGAVQGYSRNGKPIDSVLEIIQEVRELFSGQEIIIDGELYIHGTPLQSITSWVKRRQLETSFLEYWIYDCVIPDANYDERLATLRYFQARNGMMSKIIFCPTTRGCENPDETLRMYKETGYEGAILRDPNSKYEPGKRSKGLIKVKSCFDDEFEVVNITTSRDGWAILHCISNDQTFTVSAPGTVAEKTFVLKNRNDFIGKSVRVEYANLTQDGVPFHPVATMWRNKDDE